MHAEKSSRRRDPAGSRRQRIRPRVVIFALPGAPSIEVLDLPEGAGLGHRLCHGGRSWVIIGSRTGARVLIAEPEAN